MDEWLSQAANLVKLPKKPDDKSGWVDKAANDFNTAKDASMTATLDAAVKTDPNQYAQALDTSKKLNITPELAQKNLPEATQLAKTTDILKKLQDSAVVKSAFEDPSFVSLAHDDVDNLLNVHKDLISNPIQPGINFKYPSLNENIKSAIKIADQNIRILPEEAPWGQVLLNPIVTTPDRWAGIPAGLSMSSNVADIAHYDDMLKALKKPEGISLGFGMTAFKGEEEESIKQIQQARSAAMQDLELNMDAWIAAQKYQQSVKPVTNPDTLKDYASQGMTAFVDMVPVLATAYATRGRSTGAEIGLGMMGTQVFSNQFAKSYSENGGDGNAAFADATLYTIAETITEKIPLDFFVGKLGKQRLVRFLGSIGAESVQEGLSQAIESVYEETKSEGGITVGEAIKRIATDPTKRDKFLHDVKQQMIVGAMVAAPLSGAAMAGEKIVDRIANPAVKPSETKTVPPEKKEVDIPDFQSDAKAAQNADATKEKLVNLGENTKKSELFKRSPESYQKYIEQITKEGPVQDVYIDAQELTELFQTQGIDVNEVAKEVPSIAEQMDVLKTGIGDIRIPIAEYATKIAPTEFNDSVSEIARFRPEDMSPAQAKTWTAQAQEQFTQESDRIMQEKAKDTEFLKSADDVHAAIKDQIVKSGRFTSDVANKYASLHKAFAITMADKLGLTPSEVYQKYGLQVKPAPIDFNAPRTLYQDEIKSTLGIDVGEASQQEYEDVLRKLQESRRSAGLVSPAGLQTAKDVYTTVSGNPASESWVTATRIHGKDGKPLTVYRGSANPISEQTFSKERLGGKTGHPSSGLGVWSTLNREQATEYGSVIEEFHLDIRKPKIYNTDTFPGFESLDDAYKFRENLIKQGYDGIIVDARDVGAPINFVSFSPDSVIPVKKGQEFFQEKESSPIFYSALDKAIESSKQNKATPEQWYNMLKNTQGVKAEEMDTLGLKEWLDNQKGSVTKEQIADFVKAGGVQLQEVVKGDATPTKFEGYQLPGGENYREMLLRLPSSMSVLEKEFDALKNTADGFTDQYGEPKPGLAGRLARVKKRMSEIQDKMTTATDTKTNFVSPHFDESNILTHIRFNDRVDAEGKKVLFLEEIQSDWHQKGRKEGYADGKKPTGLRIATGSEEKGYFEIVDKDNNFVTNIIESTYNGPWDEASVLREAQRRVDESPMQTAAVRGVPNAPFKSSWPMLAFKRMLRYAAENGYDKVAWTTGEQQVERYKLSKRVDAIKWSPDTQEMVIYSKDGEKPIIKEVKKSELADTIGKDAAENLLKSHPDLSFRYIEGQDLKVGGEGMKAFYDKMVLNEVSRYVRKFGAKVGETTLNEPKQRYTVHSVDITDKLRESVMQGQPLFQEKRGSIQFPQKLTESPSIINLFEKADLSTFLHESGHFFFEVMKDIASTEGAPESLKKDMDTLLKYVGVESLEKWNSMSMEERRAGHEKVAESFETYLFEGKSPSVELQGLFQRFRAWLVNVYKSLKNMNADLTDEVRSVFDRMLASEEQIKNAETSRAYQPLFDSAEKAGMTQEEWAAYQELGRESSEEAIDELTARALKDMQWMTNAKNKKLKQLQKENEGKRKAVRTEVSGEVRKQPTYAAMDYLKKSPEEGGSKLSIQTLDEMYPPGDEFAPEWTKLRQGKNGMLSINGVDPDVVASSFGFSSGDKLVRELVNSKPIDEVIDAITDQKMLEKYGDITDPKSMEKAVNESIHNDVRTRFVASELRALAKATGQRQILNKAAKDYAAMAIGKKKLRDIKPNQFQSSEYKAARNADAALRKGDTEQAANHKRAQLLNNFFYKEATKAMEEIDKNINYLKKFNSEGVRKNLDPEYIEQIDNLLEPFDLRKNVSLKEIDKRKSLADWIEKQQDLGFEPAIDDVLINESKRKHYKEMTLDEMRGMVDTVKQIEHFGRLKKKLLKAHDAREFAEHISEAEKSIRENANRTVKEQPTPTDIAGQANRWLKGIIANHRKSASIVREMDGGKDGGVMWELLVRGANESGDMETELKARASNKLIELFKPILSVPDGVFKNIYARKKLIPGTDISMNHEQRMMFAMNWGNEGNRQRLMDGGLSGKRALTPQEVSAILDTLTKPEWDFTQSIWDHLETYRKQIGEQEKRLTGIEPKWIDPSPVVTKHGVYRGGYFPAKYDAELSTRSEALEAVTNLRQSMKGAFNSSSAKDSYTQKRASEVKGRPILLSYSAISQHINEVIHRLSWQDWLTDANRIIKALDAPIREHYGNDNLRELRDWVKDIAQGSAPATTYAERGINHLRIGSTIVGLGWRFTTALQQPSGLAQSWVRVGGKWMAKGVGQYLSNPSKSYELVHEKSKLMRDRNRTMYREINEVLNTVKAGEKLTVLKASYFSFIGKMQGMVDVPTWLGAYEKAQEQLKLDKAVSEAERKAIDDKAVAMADQAVIDSQSGGQLKDLAKIQRGGPLLKMFTNFYSYFSATYNLNVESFRKTNFKSPSEVGGFIADMLILNTIPVLFSVALKQLLKQDCKDAECLAKNLTQEQLNYLFGQMVLLREAGTAIGPLTGGKSYGYTGPAGLRFFSDLYKLGQQASQGEADMAFFKAFNQVGGALLHYPAGQINSTVEGIYAIEEGDVKGFFPGLAALMAGPPKR